MSSDWRTPGRRDWYGSFKAAYNLALWYEVSGQTEKAVKYYKDAAASFEPAGERLKKLIF
jgi:Flp pilus assembly protein TadD